jgi:hypothetical protein
MYYELVEVFYGKYLYKRQMEQVGMVDRVLHNDELHDVYSSHNIVITLKSRRLR